MDTWRWSDPPSRTRPQGGKAYELLVSAFDDAVVAELIESTPCTPRGAGAPDRAREPESVILSVHWSSATPTSGSWLNPVDVWFGIIGSQAIRRGTFTSVRDLSGKIRAFIKEWNQRKQPFHVDQNPPTRLSAG
ncbi:hypothetical protein H5399_14280 [Tessaracoccus sp. MC1627]|uniref:hypothetical protein n=1 Tax=Tessaracoccus sp. MC1627 TaxID=2760312 RepID=UPI001601EA13|nr:hypothetical protein [Tessaracoccus sp. MC1627]